METMKFYLISPICTICTKTDMASQEMHQMIFHMLSVYGVFNCQICSRNFIVAKKFSGILTPLHRGANIRMSRSYKTYNQGEL